MIFSKSIIKLLLMMSGGVVLIFAIVASVEVYISYNNSINLMNKAKHGDSYSQKVLGYGYETGNQGFYSLGKISKDEQKAIYWYTKSSDLGDDEAGYYLARLYERKHTQSGNDTAVKWYIKSAKSGNKNAAKKLSVIYGQGTLGKQVDKEKESYWQKRSLH